MGGDRDVVVIGAGFAGATAARECAARGLSTLVLEARDRVGGRIWSAHLSDGERVELGGTYVHWLQPHTWSEITRYGFEDDVVPGDETPEWVLSPQGDDDALAWTTAEQHEVRERALFERFFAPSRTALPRPFDPLHGGETAAALDRLSVRERFAQLALAPDDEAMLSALFASETCELDGDGGFLSLLRWWAAAGHEYAPMQEAVFGFKLRDGIVRLLEAMLADGDAELRLDTAVTGIAQDRDGVTVTCADGTVTRTRAVVVATPPAVWPELGLSPAPAPERLAAAGELQVRRAAKSVVVLRGESRRVYVQPRPGHPIGAMWTSRLRSPDEQVLVTFNGPAMDDPRDPEQVAAAIRDLLPHVEVLEVHSGVWDEHDPSSRGGWSLSRRGALTRFVPYELLAQPEGRVTFACAELGRLWNSFVDGAIESGLRAGRQARELVAHPPPR